MSLTNKLVAVGLVGKTLENLEGKTGKNRDHYVCFSKIDEFENHIDWWDSLDWDSKVDVGGVACKYGFMTAGCAWGCDEVKSYYNTLSKSQQKRIKRVFSLADEKYVSFYLPSFF